MGGRQQVDPDFSILDLSLNAVLVRVDVGRNDGACIGLHGDDIGRRYGNAEGVSDHQVKVGNGFSVRQERIRIGIDFDRSRLAGNVKSY